MQTETTYDGYRIAAFVNAHGHSANFYEEGRVHVYEHLSGQWEDIAEIPFRLTQDMSLAGLHVTLKALAERLDGCRALIVNELRGIPCAILDGMGFSLWQGRGTVREQLTTLTGLLEKKPAACGCSGAGCAPAEAEDGVVTSATRFLTHDAATATYQLDMAKALESDPALNSWQLIVPFLEITPFRELRVLCEHRPRWMEGELARLNMSVEESVAEDGNMVLRIVPIGGMRPEGAGVSPRSGAAQCDPTLQRYRRRGCGGCGG